MRVARLIVVLTVLGALASCSWSPVFRRQAELVPTVVLHDESATNTALVRSTVETILRDIAEHHGLERCRFWPSFVELKREVGRFCSPGEGVHYTLTISATQTNGGFRIKLEEPDAGAFWKAKESARASAIWKVLIMQFDAAFASQITEVNAQGTVNLRR